MDRLEAARRRTTATVSQRLLRTRSRLQEPRLQRNLRQPGRLLLVYRQRLDETFSDIRGRLDRRVAGHRQTLDGAARLLSARNPTAMALRRGARAEGAVRRAESAAKAILGQRKARLQAGVARIEALSPLAVLGRGYSICARADDDAIVRRAADVAAGDAVRVRLAEDLIDCTVDETHEGTRNSSL
jgi:exodeoxyribonuclease VII large subunit